MIRDRSNTKTAGKVPPRMADRYILRVKEADFGMSSKQKPRILLTCEIIQPTERDFEGIMYDMTSFDIPYYMMLDKDESIDRILDFHKKMGLVESIDVENPEVKPYIGMCFEAIVDSKEREYNKKDAEGNYSPIEGEDGKPVTLGWQVMGNLDAVLGRRADLENTDGPKF